METKTKIPSVLSNILVWRSTAQSELRVNLLECLLLGRLTTVLTVFHFLCKVKCLEMTFDLSQTKWATTAASERSLLMCFHPGVVLPHTSMLRSSNNYCNWRLFKDIGSSFNKHQVKGCVPVETMSHDKWAWRTRGWLWPQAGILTVFCLRSHKPEKHPYYLLIIAW